MDPDSKGFVLSFFPLYQSSAIFSLGITIYIGMIYLSEASARFSATTGIFRSFKKILILGYGCTQDEYRGRVTEEMARFCSRRGGGGGTGGV